MQFNSHSEGQDLVTDTRDRVDASASDYPINAITREINKAYHTAVVWIQSSDGTWQYDDANNTTLPIATTAIVSGQRDYSLDDAQVEVDRLEIQDSNGEWHKLEAIDYSTVDTALDEYKATNGAPTHYDKTGRSLLLYPTPDYSRAAAMKIYFKRHANIFQTTDNTKEAGFADAFHGVLSSQAALWYAKKYKKDMVPELVAEIAQYKADIMKFYGRRNRDIRKRLTMKIANSR